MRRQLVHRIIWNGCACLCLGIQASLWAAESAQAESKSADWQAHFSKGQIELGAGAGVMFSPFGTTHNRPSIRYSQAHADLGLMLTDQMGKGFYRGNFELVGEIYGAGIFKGAGDYFAGSTLGLRYNLSACPSGWVPFFQAGGGFLFTDYDRTIVGQAFNFDLEAIFGLRRFLTRNFSLNLEYRMQHISNANLGQHNLGINSHGPALSASWFF